MTTPSSFYGAGLSIDVRTPYIQEADPIGNYAEYVNSYSHVISASGGYLSATFKIVGNEIFTEDWLTHGLGRHITVYGPSAEIVWQGFVNQLNISMGGVTFSRGPLVDIANRVGGVYTPIIDATTDPPITGTALETTLVEDSNSQMKYGIWEKLLNIGTVTIGDAYYIRDLYLEENSLPDGNPSISIGNTGDFSVSIDCRGYSDWLEYIYNFTDNHLSIYLSEIVKNILGNDPNSVISTDYSSISENLVIKDPWTEDNKTAKTLIDELLALGGGSDDRWTFGIYKDRKPIYEPIPTDIEYIYYKAGTTQQIETMQGTIVEPWNVLPCKWVAIPTFLSSLKKGFGDIRNDPRVFFAEEVNFTAPDQVTINGAKVRKLAQYMAKLGLGSV